MKFLGVVGRLAFAAFLAALLIGLAASFGTRMGYWNYHVGLFAIYPYSLYIGVVAFVLGLAWVAVALAMNRATGIRYGLTAFLGSLVVLGVPLSYYLDSLGKPPIHDISTDVEHPPEFVSLLLQRQGASNSPDYDGDKRVTMDGKSYTVKQLQKKYYADIHSIGRLGISPEQLFDHAVAGARAMGWTIVAVAPDEGRIEATYTSFFFGFVSDIVIRVRPAGMGARIDIRAKSRVGQADGGTNAELIREYMKRMATG
ncbi:MAG TPA: DUF1499 domain-containing protein [Rhizomicrobium sp.]|nr:DUF1499 domain-containing protein [Rhizomicrobium sp.]